MDSLFSTTLTEENSKQRKGSGPKPLVSNFDMEKWDQQNEVASKLRYVCGFSTVIIVIVGTSALVYIVRVTLLTRKQCQASSMHRHFQPTADHLRTVDEVIDQFGTGGFQASKQGQPIETNVVG
ncbi:unnamed protein product [Haemonchus placei]|uniref:Small integral membrane protein 34B n=1 Tax=Haemonchus placei TaxID=6290 RepID=A0A0N4X5G6_HAEPC|nr:unnamed protein product [Haemonchus placei]